MFLAGSATFQIVRSYPKKHSVIITSSLTLQMCVPVHILYVIISLSIKGMLRARHGDVWELNLIFKGLFQLKILGWVLVMLSSVCCVQVSLVYRKHLRYFWARLLGDFSSTSDNGNKS